MNAGERPFAAVLDSIFGNVQDMVRSEVRLAKSELRVELRELTYGAAWFTTGILALFFATSFVLVAVFFALALVVAKVTAALILAATLLVIGAGALQLRSMKFAQYQSQTPASGRPREETET